MIFVWLRFPSFGPVYLGTLFLGTLTWSLIGGPGPLQKRPDTPDLIPKSYMRSCSPAKHGPQVLPGVTIGAIRVLTVSQAAILHF